MHTETKLRTGRAQARPRPLVHLAALLLTLPGLPSCSDGSLPVQADAARGSGLRACQDGTGAVDCCEESTRDSCSQENLRCWSTCSFASADAEDGVRGQAVCNDGKWQLGTGLFPCKRNLGVMGSDTGTLDASRGAPMVAPDAGAPRPGTILFFVPDDQTTNVSPSSLGLSVGSYSVAKTPQQSLSELASALELVRWPSAERVPSEVSYDADAGLYTTQVRLAPDVALAEGWYALRMNGAPLGAWPGYLGSALIGGVPTSRFRVGSQPLLKRIELCEKADAKTVLLVAFSESVSATNNLNSSVVLTNDGKSVRCDVTTSSGADLYLLCPSIANAAVVRIQFEGFVSTSGASLRTAAGTAPDYTIEVAGLREGSCHVFQPAPAPVP